MDILESVMKTYKFDFMLKEEQQMCIEHLLNGHNVFTLLPTGFGKSVIFSLIPLILSKKSGTRKTCLVVSPLRSLMADQVSSLTQRNIQAFALVKDATAETMKAIKCGDVDILFVSPEMLTGHKIKLIRHLTHQVCLLVFDECHCISEWGLEFRPEYRKVSDIVSVFGSVPTLLLSATATSKIQRDLYMLLALNEDTKVAAKLLDRPNVYIHIEQPPVIENMEEKLQWLLEGIAVKQEHSPKVIVYCRNLRVCERMYMWFLEEVEEKAYINGHE